MPSRKSSGQKTIFFWLGSPIAISLEFLSLRSITSFRHWELLTLVSLRKPNRNHTQSVAGPIRWISQFRPWVRHFTHVALFLVRKRKVSSKNWHKIVEYELSICEGGPNHPRLAALSYSGNRLYVDIYTDARAMSPPHTNTRAEKMSRIRNMVYL